MSLSLTQAAKAAKISKSTLSIAIRNGRVSAIHLPDGSYQIEPVELFRVFPPKGDATGIEPGVRSSTEPKPNPAEPVAPNPRAPLRTPEAGAELAVLRLKVQMLEDQLARSDRERETVLETVDDLRKRLDKAEERVLALSAPERPQERAFRSSAVVEPSRPQRSLLGRLLGR